MQSKEKYPAATGSDMCDGAQGNITNIKAELKYIARNCAEYAACLGLASLTISTIIESDREPYIVVRTIDSNGTSEQWSVMPHAE